METIIKYTCPRKTGMKRKQMRVTFFCHIKRHNTFVETILKGKIEGGEQEVGNDTS